ncbi:helix-turn-helix domain-containing protein [Cystobacter fuscus]|uniref:helix-turn-helix domain-containing protein n=1 Tax=Cystobacter fuscus TaxID=43 RepID=UPI0037C187CA
MSGALTVDEAASRLRCSRRQVFNLLAAGTLARAPKYGRKTVVTVESVALALAPPAPTQESAPTPPARPRGPRSLKASLDVLANEQRKQWRRQRVGRPIGGRVGR